MIWMDIAKKEIGQKEFDGVKHNPRILEYHKETTLSAADDETAWCSSFLNWVFKKAGFVGSRSAAAKSWALWGEKLDSPKYGCVVVFPNHVGLFIKEVPLFVCVLGGNQKDEVRESWFYKRNIISYRWPLGVDSTDSPEAS